MAAVQDLLRWLKVRRSLRRNKRKDKECKTSPSSPQLGSRAGVALPPIPPPGFWNLPDISRDCSRSPYHVYDEIPAYAIDTRLDILRETQQEMMNKQLDHQRTGNTVPYFANPSHTSQYIPSGRDWDRRDVHPNHSQEQYFSHNQDTLGESARYPPRLPRQGTPWHHYQSGDSPLQSASMDQLDQWVPVQDSLNALSIKDDISDSHKHPTHQRTHVRTHSADGRHWANSDVASQIELRNCANTMRSQGYANGGHVQPSTHCMRNTHGYPGETSRNVQLDKPVTTSTPTQDKPDTWSDDSGVSSPANTSVTRDERDTPWGPGIHKGTHVPTKNSHYSDTDTSTCSSHRGVSTSQRWCDISTQGAKMPTTCAHSGKGFPNAHSRVYNSVSSLNRNDISRDSLDTYNEYDRSDLDSSRSKDDSFTPQEYNYYLGKTQQQMKLTCGIKNLMKGQSRGHPEADDVSTRNADVPSDTIDLTSVTDLSDTSTFSDDEVYRLTSASCAKANKQTRHNSKSAPNVPHPKHTQPRHGHGETSEKSSSNQHSAFRPYHSQRRHSYSVPPAPAKGDKTTLSRFPSEAIEPVRSSPVVMALEDRLSVRATSSNASTLKPPSGARAPHNKTKRMSALIPQTSSSQNKVLSDLMRINHDRQILSLI